MARIVHRLSVPTLGGTMLAGGCTWLAALEDIETATSHTPGAASDALRILATIRGSATLETDAGDLRLGPGSIVLLAPRWAYRRRVNSGRWHHRSLLLRGAWADLYVRFCNVDGTLALTSPAPAWRSWIGEAVELALAQRPGWDAGVAARLALVAEALAAAPATNLAGRLARAVAAEPGRRWQVADLAALCGLGGSGFAHRFRRETGESPARWLLRRRIDAACRLLAMHAPGEVADLLGFATPFHFSRVFRRIRGEPPSAYRRRLACDGI